MNRSITLLKKIDAVLGPPLLGLATLGKPKSRLPNGLRGEIGSILIIRPGGIGDAVLLIPTLKILRGKLPNGKIHILCEPRNMGIFFTSPFVDRIFNYRDFKDLISVQKNQYEMVIDTEQSHFFSTILASKFRRSVKVGFATNGRDAVYDVGIKYSQEQYEMNSFSRLFEGVIEGWSSQHSWDPPYLYPLPEERRKVSELLLGKERPIVCLFPGASIEQRRWPAGRWRSVAGRLWRDGFQPVLLGGANERGLTHEITTRADCSIVNLCGMLTLSETAALFERSRILVSTDSGILHLGVIAGLPTVSLFGPGIAKKWGPKGERHIVLNKELACSPCTRFGETPPCPIGVQCMKAITVDDVMKAASEFIGK